MKRILTRVQAQQLKTSTAALQAQIDSCDVQIAKAQAEIEQKTQERESLCERMSLFTGGALKDELADYEEVHGKF